MPVLAAASRSGAGGMGAVAPHAGLLRSFAGALLCGWCLWGAVAVSALCKPPLLPCWSGCAVLFGKQVWEMQSGRRRARPAVARSAARTRRAARSAAPTCINNT